MILRLSCFSCNLSSQTRLPNSKSFDVGFFFHAVATRKQRLLDRLTPLCSGANYSLEQLDIIADDEPRYFNFRLSSFAGDRGFLYLPTPYHALALLARFISFFFPLLICCWWLNWHSSCYPFIGRQHPSCHIFASLLITPAYLPSPTITLSYTDRLFITFAFSSFFPVYQTPSPGDG